MRMTENSIDQWTLVVLYRTLPLIRWRYSSRICSKRKWFQKTSSAIQWVIGLIICSLHSFAILVCEATTTQICTNQEPWTDEWIWGIRLQRCSRLIITPQTQAISRATHTGLIVRLENMWRVISWRIRIWTTIIKKIS